MGVRISDLTEASACTNDDNFAIAGESETKRITFRNLLAQLSAAISGGGTATETYTRTWNGLTVRVKKTGQNVYVSMVGTASSAISTKNRWESVGSYASEGITPAEEIIGYEIINSIQAVRYKWTTAGEFSIGYCRITDSGSAANIARNYVVNLQFSFCLG